MELGQKVAATADLGQVQVEAVYARKHESVSGAASFERRRLSDRQPLCEQTRTIPPTCVKEKRSTVSEPLSLSSHEI